MTHLAGVDDLTLQVLSLELDADAKSDSGADTIGGYLCRLLMLTVTEGEGFDGKRPFGNSGWDSDLFKPLIKAGLVAGGIDQYGSISGCDFEAAETMLLETISEVFGFTYDKGNDE